MRVAAAFRGQPLLLLAGVLGCWMALRLALWEAPFLPATRAFAPAPTFPRVPFTPGARSRPPIATSGTLHPAMAAQVPRLLAGFPPASPRLAHRAAEPPRQTVLPLASGSAPALTQRLSTAGLAADLASTGVPPPSPLLLPAPVPARSGAGWGGLSRWSGDGWVLLRRDTSTPLLSDRPSYGRSQAGAVLRYRLAPGSANQPEAYVRGSLALAGANEQELAIGLSGRPIGSVPLRIAAEARLHETGDGREARPAAIAVSELPPVGLPLGFTGELYLQAGYVGGEFASAFIDGQARVDRTLARLGANRLVGGVGFWGGAQKGAERVDAGPTLALTVPLGSIYVRLAADYRWRIAGDAAPASGPALTVSAGF
jgi:hypothetical protein